MKQHILGSEFLEPASAAERVHHIAAGLVQEQPHSVVDRIGRIQAAVLAAVDGSGDDLRPKDHALLDERDIHTAPLSQMVTSVRPRVHWKIGASSVPISRLDAQTSTISLLTTAAALLSQSCTPRPSGRFDRRLVLLGQEHIAGGDDLPVQNRAD